MKKKGRINRREFLKVGALGIGTAAVGNFGFPFIARAAKGKIKDPIKIGCQGIGSGTQGMWGIFMQEGARMAIDEINAKGGILGSKIEFEFRDEELKPDVAVKTARYLVNSWGADFIVGCDTSGTALAVGEIMPELNRILIVSHGSTNKFNEDLVYKRRIKQCFRISSPLYIDGIGAALLANELGIKRWAGIEPDYEFGHTGWKLFKSTLKALRPDVEFVAESFAKFGTVDFSSHIVKVMAANPEGIHTLEWGGECVALVKQAKLYGVFDKIKVWANPQLAAMDALMGLGRECPEGAWSTSKYWFLYPDTIRNRTFVEAYVKRYSKYPAHNSETAYAAVYTIKNAVEKAESLEIDPLIAAMEGMEIDRPAGPCYIRKEDHQAVYTSPWGQLTHDQKYPFAIMKNLKVYPAEKIYRKPPFPAIE